MKIAIYGQAIQEEDFSYLNELLEELEKIGATVFFEKKFAKKISSHIPKTDFGVFTQNEGLNTSFDIFVSFGGDGTMLRAVTYVKNLGIPMVGVNTGRLGFLSTFKKEDVRKVVTPTIGIPKFLT